MSKKRGKTQSVTVTLCVIARNEEDFIGACLDSAREFVDEIVVVDTGSTDRTVAIAQERGARLEYFEWCDDFAAARNFAIEHATSDWILMLDADEELDPATAANLRSEAGHMRADMVGFAVPVENRARIGSGEETAVHVVTRFFPRRSWLRYQGAIHEDLANLREPRRNQVQIADNLRIFHYGYDPAVYAARDKDARNMRLLQNALEKHPDDARILFHLGQQSFAGKRYADTDHWFQRFEARAGTLADYYLVEAYRIWLEALVRLEAHAQVEQVAARAEHAGALCAFARETLGNYQRMRGNFAAARELLLSALQPGGPRGITTPVGVAGWRTRLFLAELYQVQGEVDLALAEINAAYAEAPSHRRQQLARNAAQYAAAGNRPNIALQWIGEAQQLDSESLDYQLETLQLKLQVLGRAPVAEDDLYGAIDTAVHAGDWQAAYDAGKELGLGGTATLSRLVYLASRLREMGAPEAALVLLGRTLDAYAPTSRVYWLLIQVLKDLDRIDDALNAVEVLRNLPAAA